MAGQILIMPGRNKYVAAEKQADVCISQEKGSVEKELASSSSSVCHLSSGQIMLIYTISFSSYFDAFHIHIVLLNRIEQISLSQDN